MRTRILMGFVLGITLLPVMSTSSSAQTADECLLGFQDTTGIPLADGSTVCQTAVGKSCEFNLKLCVNELQEGCTAASLPSKAVHATGHCGPVRKLQVHPSGSSAVCGDPAVVRVRTRQNGKRVGTCTISARVQSAKTNARIDKDKLVLMCEPSTATCPTTTTTTVTTTTTTTTTL